MYEGTHVVDGHNTPAFWKLQSRKGPLPKEDFCFSVVTSTRTLDLAAESLVEAQDWKLALNHFLVSANSPNKTGSHISQSTIAQSTKSAWGEMGNNGLAQASGEFDTHRSMSSKSGRFSAVASSREDAADAVKRQEQAMIDQMFQAAHTGNFQRLSEALHVGTPVNLSEKITGDTPLMIACRKGYPSLVKLCLHFGAKNDPHPQYGQTALHAAVDSGQYAAAAELLDAAALSKADVTIANLADPMGQTPLHTAASRGNPKILELLLEHGADVCSEDDACHTCLHIVAANGNKDCMSLILDHGGDEVMECQDSPEKNTPLHLAACNGHLACVRLLLETAANVFAKTAKGMTPYNLACVKGYHQVGLLLLEYQDVNAQSNSAWASPPMKSQAQPHVTPHLTPHTTPSKSKSMSIDTTTYDNSSNGFLSPQMTVFKFSQYATPTPDADTNLPRPHTFASPIQKTGKGIGISPRFSNDNLSGPNSAPASPGKERVLSLSAREFGRGSNYSSPAYSGPSSSRDLQPLAPFSPAMYVQPSNLELPRPGTETSFSSMRTREGMGAGAGGGGRTLARDSTTDSLSSVLTTQMAWTAESQDSYQDTSMSSASSMGGYRTSSTSAYSSGNADQQTRATYASGYDTSYDGGACEQAAVESEAVTDYQQPIESFYFADGWWESYYNEEGYVYYLDTYTSHSQWEDPRENGVVVSNYEDDAAVSESPGTISSAAVSYDAEGKMDKGNGVSGACEPIPGSKPAKLSSKSGSPHNAKAMPPSSRGHSPKRFHAPRTITAGEKDGKSIEKVAQFQPRAESQPMSRPKERLSVDDVEDDSMTTDDEGGVHIHTRVARSSRGVR
jgi:ankyrin repeat protein